MSGSPLDPLVDLATHLAITLGGIALATLSTVMFLRWLGLHWSWTLPGVLLGPALWSFDQGPGVIAATALLATVTGARWHHDDLRHGGDRGQDARDRRTPLDTTRARLERRSVRGGRWVDRRGLAVGRDERGRTVRMPVGHRSGRHTLIVGATGSGKTVTQAWIAGRLVREGYGADVIGPKGDRLLHDELEHAARKTRRTFRVVDRRWARRSTTRSRTAPTPSSATRSWPTRPTPNRTTSGKRSASSATPSARCAARGAR